MNISTKPFISLTTILSIIIILNNFAFCQIEWVKHEENPVLKIGAPGTWNDQYIGSPSVVFDGKLYHMWFDGFNSSTNVYHIGYATSSDGVKWIEHESNPIFSGTGGDNWDAHNVGDPCVIYSDSLFHMWYLGWRNETGITSVGYASSSDGINWERYDGNPVITRTEGSWEEFGILSASVVLIDSKFHLWYNSYSISPKIGYATSDDGLKWEKYASNPVIDPQQIGARGIEMCQVLNLDGVFKMWFDYGSGLQDIGYAEASDGIKWCFYEGNPVLGRGKSGEWDNSAVFYSTVNYIDNEYKMWYMGASGNDIAIGLAASAHKEHDLATRSFYDSLTYFPQWCRFIFEPKIKLRNNGLSDESNFQVVCTIDSAGTIVYNNSQTINFLENLSLQHRIVNFDPWNCKIFNENIFKVIYRTTLSSDQNSMNDTIIAQIAISDLIDDFESNIHKWNSDSSWNTTYQSPHSGRKCLRNTDKPIYENGMNSVIEFKYPFDLSQLNTAHISYWTKYFIETGKDFGYMEISADGGQTWAQLSDTYTGIRATWTQEFLSLNEYCGHGFDNVMLRFHFVSDTVQGYPALGWYIDDIKIQNGPIPTFVSDHLQVAPTEFKLFENYPNPFNSYTTIQYQLASNTHVKLAVYNLLGQKIIELINEKQSAGRYSCQWNGKDKFGNVSSSGVYLFKIETEQFSEIKKMLFLK